MRARRSRECQQHLESALRLMAPDQVGDVDARNQQHERDRPEQQQQRRPQVADDRFVQRPDADAHVLVLIGELRREPRCDHASL